MKIIGEVSTNSYRVYDVVCDYCLKSQSIGFIEFNEVHNFIENLKKQGWVFSDSQGSIPSKDFCCEKCKELYEKEEIKRNNEEIL